MDLKFDRDIGRGCPSPSQRARVLTEAWVHEQVYCPNCGRGLKSRFRLGADIGVSPESTENA